MRTELLRDRDDADQGSAVAELQATQVALESARPVSADLVFKRNAALVRAIDAGMCESEVLRSTGLRTGAELELAIARGQYYASRTRRDLFA